MESKYKEGGLVDSVGAGLDSVSAIVFAQGSDAEIELVKKLHKLHIFDSRNA